MILELLLWYVLGTWNLLHFGFALLIVRMWKIPPRERTQLLPASYWSKHYQPLYIRALAWSPQTSRCLTRASNRSDRPRTAC